MLIYGHRGASRKAPENTLTALRAAIDSGCDGLEFDVQSTADGVLVLLHDRTVNRTTDGTGAIDRLSWSDVELMKTTEGTRIPTLAEALDLVGAAVHLDIELKQAGIEEAVLSCVADFPRTRWAISSFDWIVLRRCRALSSDCDIWPLATHHSDALVSVANDLGATAVSLWAGSYDGATADHLAEHGLRAMLWTVNDVEVARTVSDLGAHAICTDVPELFVADGREGDGGHS